MHQSLGLRQQTHRRERQVRKGSAAAAAPPLPRPPPLRLQRLCLRLPRDALRDGGVGGLLPGAI